MSRLARLNILIYTYPSIFLILFFSYYLFYLFINTYNFQFI
jgi:hypothetical protein